MQQLEKRVLGYIGELSLLAPGDKVGIAVSGGADSVALLRLLTGMRQRLGVALLAVHFDHGLRGAESDADAEFVAALAREYGLPFVLERADVRAAAKQEKWNLEDAARRLRYAFFNRLAETGAATRIAVAHTASDQAETVLAHLFRGSGPAGLAGIYPQVGPIVRPLLGIQREQLRAYLRCLGQCWREDSSNNDLTRMRARIRAKLLPILADDFSSNVAVHLAGFARLAREEREFWDVLTEHRFQALKRRGENGIAIRVDDLLAPMKFPDLPRPSRGNKCISGEPLRALTQRLIRRAYEEVRGTREGLTAFHVGQVIRLAESQTGGQCAELPGGILVKKSYGEITFACTAPARRGVRADGRGASAAPETRAYSYSVQLQELGSTSISVPELHRRFRLKKIDWTCMERETRRGRSALDAGRLRMPLILRNWRPGDAYRPLGRRHTLKLKQMFAAGRIPACERAGWPVLESDGHIIWARGLPAAGEFCAGEETVVGVLVEEESL